MDLDRTIGKKCRRPEELLWIKSPRLTNVTIIGCLKCHNKRTCVAGWTYGECQTGSLVQVFGEMFYLIGLGLGDPKDVTVKGLEIIKKCDRVYLESYTSILTCGQTALVMMLDTSWYFILFRKGNLSLISLNLNALYFRRNSTAVHWF